MNRAANIIVGVAVAACFVVCLIVFIVKTRTDGPEFGIPSGPMWSEAGYQLILDFEVGGGRIYYDQHLARPVWPGFASGVTIGVGYDLGYTSSEIFKEDWYKLDYIDRARLSETSGITGQQARYLVPSVKDILIGWPYAEEVYQGITIGRYWQITCRAFPGVESLHPKTQWSCLSLIFNRGPDMTGYRNKEKRELRDAVADKDYQRMADLFRSMTRVWVGTDIEKGMRKRRFAEADLIATSLRR